MGFFYCLFFWLRIMINYDKNKALVQPFFGANIVVKTFEIGQKTGANQSNIKDYKW